MFIGGYGYNSHSSLNVVNTSRGPNRGVGGGQCGCVYLIFLSASFGYFKNLNHRTGWFQVFGGNQNQRTSKVLSSFLFEFKIFCWVGVKCRYHKNSICWGQVFQILASASYVCLYTMSDPPVGVWSKIKRTAQHWWRVETSCCVRQVSDGVCIAPHVLPPFWCL